MKEYEKEYECDRCDKTFIGKADPQDTGDGPLCNDCWNKEN